LPTPLGHSLAGYAFARLTRVRITRDERRLFVFAACIAVLPDALGESLAALTHTPTHGFAHSVAALLLVSVVVAGLGTRRGFRFWPVLLLVAAAYGSHLVADLLRPEVSPDDGEQLFWPLRGAYAISLNILPHIPNRGDFTGTAAYAWGIGAILLRELLVLGPLALLAHFIPPRIPAHAAAPPVSAPAASADPEAR